MTCLVLLKDYFNYEEYTAAGKCRSGEVCQRLLRIIQVKLDSCWGHRATVEAGWIQMHFEGGVNKIF